MGLVAQITCCGHVKSLLVQEKRAYTTQHDNKIRVWRKHPRLKLLGGFYVQERSEAARTWIGKA